MDALAAPFAVGAALLVGAGATKVVDPSMTVGALRAAGLRVPGWAVRAGAGAELAVGAAALVVASWALSAAVAVSYLAFAAFVARALTSGTPVGTCGCFGRADTPPSAAHVVINLTLAATAVATGVAGGVDVPGVVADQPWAGVPFLASVALGTVLVVVALTLLPRTTAAARAVARR